jgi:large subunit ribosomal protein L29
MKTKELRNKSAEELQKDFVAFKKELFNLRFQRVQGQVAKTHRIKQIKKAVARIQTLLKELVLGIKHEKKASVAKPKKVAAPKEVKKEETKEIKKAAVKSKAGETNKQKTIKKDKKNA